MAPHAPSLTMPPRYSYPTSQQLQNVQRVDVAWYEYEHGSLKAYTCSVKGMGSRRRVESSNALPKTGRNDNNKAKSVFSFLGLQTACPETEHQIIVT